MCCAVRMQVSDLVAQRLRAAKDAEDLSVVERGEVNIKVRA